MSKVYFTDFRTRIDVPLTDKLKKLCRLAGLEQIDMKGRFVAIKMHFGELGTQHHELFSAVGTGGKGEQHYRCQNDDKCLFHMVSLSDHKK